ncbi:DUF1643 domain-containing protein [Cryobacterium sp. TMT1-66-1]|nr:DUF1643 domain-containing protein [Cryobacterium sp. TMT1-66-1]
MNPSHARKREADKTVRRLIEASQQRRYAGWVMLNLCIQSDRLSRALCRSSTLVCLRKAVPRLSGYSRSMGRPRSWIPLVVATPR